jgi:hypothetical protein
MDFTLTNSDSINVSFSLSGGISISGGGNSNGNTPEVDPTVPQHVKDISQSDIGNWNGKADQSSLLTEVSSRIQGDSNQQQYTDQQISLLKDGVPTAGDTLQKLFNLFVGCVTEVTVADIAARNAYDAPIGGHVFVLDDGDGQWALYKAITGGINSGYIKLSDPDLLNAVLTASQIKSSYESNPDTNAFTNALLVKLNGIAANATANATDTQLRDRSTHTGTQDAATITGNKTSVFISDFATAALAVSLAGYAAAASRTAIANTDSVLQAFNKIGKWLADLGDAAFKNTGTAAGTVAAGDDSRLSNSRQCNNSFDNAATARLNLGLGDAATKNTGTAAGTVAAGDDSRLSNSRQCNNSFDNAATARLNLGLRIYILTADDPGVTGTTLQEITDGSQAWNWSIAANESYVFEAHVLLTTSGASGVQAAVTVPSGAALFFTDIANSNSATTVNVSTVTSSGTKTGTLVSFTASANGFMVIKGSVINGSNAGTVSIRYADANASQTATAKKGSYLKIEKV